MFRASAYSIETDQQWVGKSEIKEEVRVALVGVSDVGKSSILTCMHSQKFREDISNTQGFQLRFKKLRINHHIISLHMWDGAGDNIDQFIHDKHFHNIDCVLEVFDLTDKESLLELEDIHTELKKDFAQRNKPLVAILVGNKYDLLVGMDIKNHEQMNSMAEKFAERNNVLYLKVSAKKNSFITDTFVEAIRQTFISRKLDQASRLFEDEEPKYQGCSCSCSIF